MPIRREQFDEGVTPHVLHWISEIHNLLAENRELAYTEEEIQEHCAPAAIRYRVRTLDEESAGPEPPAGASAVMAPPKDRKKAIHGALRKLVQLEAIETRMAGGVRYYAYKGDLPDLG